MAPATDWHRIMSKPARKRSRNARAIGTRPRRRSATPPAVTRLIAFNKPFRVLTQFTDADNRATLKDYIDIPDVYPAGRLDRDSEGLLLLTNDGPLHARISNPKHKLPKTYWAQVDGDANPDQLARLSAGPTLKDGPTHPADVNIIAEPDLWPRDPPVRYRKNVPTTWLALTIREGRNRQVRRMTAAVGLPTLRLVRIAIGDWRLDNLEPGKARELDADGLHGSGHGAQSGRR